MRVMARVWLAVAAVFGLAGPLPAQDLTAQQQDRVLSDPAAFLEAAATATHWFGDPRGLDASAVQDYVAAMRAARRADVTALLLQADLSDDGTATMAEVLRLAPGLTPSARGKLIARAGLADADGDGAVTPAELQAYARAEALRLVPDRKAQDLQMILLFDGDRDGWVRYDEVVQALNGLTAAAAPCAKGGACARAEARARHLTAAAKPAPPGSQKPAPFPVSDAR